MLSTTNPAQGRGLLSRWICALVLCVALSGCKSQKSPKVNKAKVRPQVKATLLSVSTGKEMAEKAPILVRFRRPVVPEEMLGQPFPLRRLTTTPALALIAVWQDRNTLRIDITNAMQAATRYQLRIKWPAARFDHKFGFVFKPLRSRGVFGVNTTKMPLAPKLKLLFNQPVAPAAIRKHCTLWLHPKQKKTAKAAKAAKGPKANVRIPFAVLTKKTHKQLVLKPTNKLLAGRQYQLLCPSLVGTAGQEPLAKPLDVMLRTHSSFYVSSFSPKRKQVLPYNSASIELFFSTPVSPKALRKAVWLKPRRAWKHFSSSVGHKRFVLTPKITEINKTFTLYVSKQLKDVYGQRLTKGFALQFRSGPAQPELVVERGFFTVESRRGYPVWTQDMKSVQVRCALVPAPRLLNAMETLRSYHFWNQYKDPRDDRDDKDDKDDDDDDYNYNKNRKIQEPMKWGRFYLKKPKARRVALSPKTRKWVRSHIDLHKACGSKSRYGLFIAEFFSPDDTNTKDSPGLGKSSPHRVAVNVTDLGVVLKVGSSSGLVWVTSIDTGAAVAGANVEIYRHNRKLLFKGKTDAQGRLMLPGADALHRKKGAVEKALGVWVLVRKGKDVTVMDSRWSEGIQGLNFSLPVDFSGKSRKIRGHIQSDRGLYKPGEKVSFKGLLREVLVGQVPRIPKGRRIRVRITNGRNEEVYKRRCRLSPFGSFDFTYRIPKTASVGDYHVTATFGGQTFQEKFVVEEFRKLRFTVEMGAPAYATINQTLSLAVKAKYLFGAPMPGAPVEWSVMRRSRHMKFANFPMFQFTDWLKEGGYTWWNRSHVGAWEKVTDDKLTLDSAGKGKFAIKLSPKGVVSKGGIPRVYDFLIQATATDEGDQKVSKKRIVQVHPSDFYVGLYYADYVWKAGSPFRMKVVALTPDGKQIAAKAKLHIYRKNNRYDKSTNTSKYNITKEIQIPANGVSMQNFTPPVPGIYNIQVEATDSKGRKTVASDYIWVTGAAGFHWGKLDNNSESRITLLANKASFKPGESARLLTKTTMKASSALVTIERSGVIDSFVIKNPKPGQGIEIPIKANYAPNVFVSVILVQKHRKDKHAPRFKMGMQQLKVSAAQQRLAVNITTSKKSYKPGQWVQGMIQVTSQGKPVHAEVSLSVADEGLLQLIAYQTPDPMKAFYAPWGHGLRNSTNWLRLVKLRSVDAIAGDQGAVGGGDDDGETTQRVRSRFVSSAYWAPRLVTDATGTIKFRFRAPDNLTAWRLMAVAADKGARFGAAERQITTRMPLMIQPILPRFLIAGDKVHVGVIAHNNTTKDGTLWVRAKASGIKIAKSLRKLRLRKGSSTRVIFPLEIKESTRHVTFRFYASMGKHKDALRKRLPVHEILSRDVKWLAKGRMVDHTKTIALSWPKGTLLSHSHIEFSADQTGLSDLREGLRYLVQYPHGCLEQTLSKSIPLLKAKELVSSLGLPFLKGRRMRRFLREGFDKIQNHQHKSGHFQLWPESSPSPFLTAYAMFGLNEARRARLSVSKSKLKLGRMAMRTWANKQVSSVSVGKNGGTIAMMAFVLADMGAADTGLNARLFKHRNSLPTYGKAFLLRALIKAKAPRVQQQTLGDELLRTIQLSGALATVKPCKSLYTTAICNNLRWEMGSDIRTTAMLLSALLDHDAKHPVIPKLVAGLKAARLPNGRWRNTQENVYALVALADFARAASRQKTRVILKLGKKKWRRRLRPKRIVRITRSLKKQTPGPVTLQIKGTAYANLRLTLVRKDKGDKPVARGFALKREYFDMDTKTPITSTKVGQLVLVRLAVRSAGNQHYVALVDHLPAGLEAINPKFATSADVKVANDKMWLSKEFRDERVSAYANKMAAGTHTFSYVARATVAGTFTARPATIEAMYEPEYMGRTTKASLQVAR